MSYCQKVPVLPLVLLLFITLIYVLFDLTVERTEYRPLNSIFPFVNNISNNIRQMMAQVPESKDITEDDLRFIHTNDSQVAFSESSSLFKFIDNLKDK